MDDARSCYPKKVSISSAQQQPGPVGSWLCVCSLRQSSGWLELLSHLFPERKVMEAKGRHFMKFPLEMVSLCITPDETSFVTKIWILEV